MKLLLMNYPHHCPSVILWLCCNATAYCNPTLSSLSVDILLIGIITIWLVTCVPREVHYPMIQRIFGLQYNLTVPWILIPTRTFSSFLCLTLLYLLLIQSYILNFPVATPLISRWEKLVVGAFLPGTCQIHTFHCPFLVPLNLLFPMRRLLAEALIPFHTCNSMSWCINL